MKIAEALVLRKHLEAKVEQLKPLKINGDNGVYETQTKRVKVSEEVDEVSLQIARVDIKTVTTEYDKYSKALRLIDVAIQKANWEAEVDYTPEKGIEV